MERQWSGEERVPRRLGRDDIYIYVRSIEEGGGGEDEEEEEEEEEDEEEDGSSRRQKGEEVGDRGG